MIESTIKAVLGIMVIAGGWLTVQMAWRKVFAGTFGAQDPMVDRCGGCGCYPSNCDEATAQEDGSPLTPHTNHGGQ